MILSQIKHIKNILLKINPEILELKAQSITQYYGKLWQHMGMFAVTSPLGLVGREVTTVLPLWLLKCIVLTRFGYLPELVFLLWIKIQEIYLDALKDNIFLYQTILHKWKNFDKWRKNDKLYSKKLLKCV